MGRVATPEELAAAEALQRHSGHLLELGPRDDDHPLGLADATDWLFLWAESTGNPVRRIGFSTAEGAGQNLELLLSGESAELPRVVVTVPYDSTTGDDDWRSAMAAAFQMELAASLKQAPLPMPVALVWLSHTGASALEHEVSGSFAYAKQARIREEAFELVLNLRFTSASSEQAVLVGSRRAADPMLRLTRLLQQEPELQVQSRVEHDAASDARPFDRAEYRALDVQLGLPTPGDSAARSAARWLKRVDRALRGFVRSNPGSTPPPSVVRARLGSGFEAS